MDWYKMLQEHTILRSTYTNQEYCINTIECVNGETTILLKNLTALSQSYQSLSASILANEIALGRWIILNDPNKQSKMSCRTGAAPLPTLSIFGVPVTIAGQAAVKTCCDKFRGHGWRLCQKCGKEL